MTGYTRKRRNTFFIIYTVVFVLIIAAAIVARLSESPVYERDHFERVVHVVGRGEAAWDYAEEYCPADMDKREYLEMCAKENGMEGMMGHINYGESYIFLKLKEEKISEE